MLFVEGTISAFLILTQRVGIDANDAIKIPGNITKYEISNKYIIYLLLINKKAVIYLI